MSSTPAQIEEAQKLKEKVESGEEVRVPGHVYRNAENIPEDETHPSGAPANPPASANPEGPASLSGATQPVGGGARENLRDAYLGVNRAEEIASIPPVDESQVPEAVKRTRVGEPPESEGDPQPESEPEGDRAEEEPTTSS